MNNRNEPASPTKATMNRNTKELEEHQFGNDDFVCLGLTKLETLAMDLYRQAAFGSDSETLLQTANVSLIQANAFFDALEENKSK